MWGRLLTCAPIGNRRKPGRSSRFRSDRPGLLHAAYSCGAVADLHRLPEHPSPANCERTSLSIACEAGTFACQLLSESGTGFFPGIVDRILRAIERGARHVNSFERVVAGQYQNHMVTVQRIGCRKSQRFRFRSMLFAGNAEQAAVGVEADPQR